MVWTIWLLIWIFGGGFPLATAITWLTQKIFRKRGLYSQDEVSLSSFLSMGILRGVFSLIFGLLMLLFMLVDTSMWWVFLIWTVIWTILETFIIDTHWSLKLLSVVGLIVLIGSGVYITLYAGYNNALYFDQFIQQGEGFPIMNEVPDHLLRLTTEDLAASIAKQRMSEFGSNVAIVDMQVTMYKERLVWVALVAQQEAWGATFQVEGMIIVDANDPDRPPEIVRDEQFAVADGLTFNPLIGANGNAKARGYFGMDTSLVYGDVYPVLTPESKWAIAMTTYRLEFFGVQRYTGVYLFDKMGNIIDFFEKDIPDWLIQPFDENGFLEGGINSWGRSKRGNGFDAFAGGFLWIGASQERVQMTEDTRYIFDPDNNQIVAIAMTNPIRDKGEFSLAGALKATSKGITHYDLSQYNFMSGNAAGSVLLSKVGLKTDTDYYTEMELLYPLKVGNETKQVWFVPIYFENQQTLLIGLAGLGIIDAQAQNKWVIEYTEQGLTGSTLIKQAKESFRSLFADIEPEIPESRIVNGTLIAKYPTYDKNGTTHQWLTLEDSEGQIDILVRANLLTDTEMLTIQKTQIGDRLTIEITKDMIVIKVLPEK